MSPWLPWLSDPVEMLARVASFPVSARPCQTPCSALLLSFSWGAFALRRSRSLHSRGSALRGLCSGDLMLCRVKLLSWSGSLFSLFYQLLVGKACLLASENMEQVRSSLMAVPNTELQGLSLFNFFHRLEFYQWGSQAWEWGTVQGHMWGSECEPSWLPECVWVCVGRYEGVCACAHVCKHVHALSMFSCCLSLMLHNRGDELSVWPEKLMFKVQTPSYRTHGPALL